MSSKKSKSEKIATSSSSEDTQKIDIEKPKVTKDIEIEKSKSGKEEKSKSKEAKKDKKSKKIKKEKDDKEDAEMSKREKKKAFKPKQLLNSDWAYKAVQHTVLADDEKTPLLNAVKTGSFMGSKYLNIGHYDFHYDNWITQLKFSWKPKDGKKQGRWKPKNAYKRYFVTDKEIVTEIAKKLEKCGEQSDSEVEYKSSSESEESESE